MTTHTLCHINDIKESQAKGFTLSKTSSVFAVKKNGLIYTYKNSCPHLGVELEWLEDQFLDFENVLIQCSTHGALFLIETGECVSGPCQGQNLSIINNSIDDQGQITIEAH